MKTTFIATVYNEEETIDLFLDSIQKQTKKPDEIVIVDGGSKDSTLEILRKNKQNIVLLRKKGNRAVGRNFAIKKAKNEIILVSDAGCVLDKNWVKNISIPLKYKKVDVVAGYYRGLAKTVFQKCLIPYVLVMPDRVNPKTFLPASRSMAFRKDIWEKTRGFSQNLSHNEDYDFAKKIKKINAEIVFQKNAVVYWIPRDSLWEAYIMFYRFALGDAEAGIFRTKVALVFLRYLSVTLLLFVILSTKKPLYVWVLGLFLVSYIFFSVEKNYKYVNDYKAFLYLPLLQILSDVAIIIGTILGLVRLVKK